MGADIEAKITAVPIYDCWSHKIFVLAYIARFMVSLLLMHPSVTKPKSNGCASAPSQMQYCFCEVEIMLKFLEGEFGCFTSDRSIDDVRHVRYTPSHMRIQKVNEFMRFAVGSLRCVFKMISGLSKRDRIHQFVINRALTAN